MPLLSITHGSWGTSLKPRDLSELVRFVCQSKGDLRSPYSAFHSRSTLPYFVYPGGIFIYTTSSRSQCTKALTASIWTVLRSNFAVIAMRVWKAVLASVVALVGRSPLAC